MRNSVKTLAAAAALIASAALAPALYAHDSGSSDEHDGSMMGPGMMNMMGQMSQMMDNCSEMMQGTMGDGSGKPNEQWRKDAPTALGTND